ncbi:UDP-N-acetylmuramoyl-L-alanyl-D-glutamate--2,6-diaminopimelate ligase [Wolbachia endosymbiont of Ctenocephalides felis wCfeT]|uniref:UDP-N-acetylmuramoyl-L-alanyl-D-glutamate--2, 6-diaminopimelate ligase n=1 Tax=Wolbachia endosymbiont of Ctenocephalides felis wCfeT TaxID=2732593 RepID=UPI0014487777|nr:UDP-N-acetylmuramoyl-L-alanyl-D-glutamate--2,6-diaminopimelate ligase [Wolbachia endosymbiont of Ctenocephalides felis wCfeT]
MKLKELLRDIIDVDFDFEVKGVTCNLRRVKEGYLFVCLSDEGKKYLSDALKKASVIPVSKGCHPSAQTLGSRVFSIKTIDFFAYEKSWIPASRAGMTDTPSIAVLDHLHPQKIYSKIVSRFYQFKQPKYVAAVTGTNGKTSVVDFCRQIWRNAGYNVASVGTLGTYINDEKVDSNSNLTTPSAKDLYSTLRDINDKNIEYLVLEASSHGIDQYRIHGLKLNAAAFTNLLQDHLDYHGNIDEYFNAKKRLFSEVLQAEGAAILNADIDGYSTLLGIAKKHGNKVITYGKIDSDIILLRQIPTTDGQHLTIKIEDEVLDTFFPVMGKFQAYNLLCAMSIVISSGMDYRQICVQKLTSPPGRMEKVNSFIFVDYAHTANALEQALLSLKWHFNKKIVLVFGCGGNRDQSKRTEMGKIAQVYADKVIITDDNPRNEDPAKIRHDILSHCPNALEIRDRREAIKKGMSIAYNEDMVLLIAGKGHEQFQIIGDQAFEFSDAEITKLYE